MEKIKNQEIYLFLFTILACFVAVYLVPPTLNKIFFLGLFFVMMNSKKNYFWFALFFVLAATPGSLFWGGSGEMEHRLPLLKVVQGFSFSVFDIFLILSTVKAAIKGKRYPREMSIMYTILGVLYLSYFLYSLVLGMDKNSLVTFIRHTLFFTLLYSMPRLMPGPQNMYKLAHLVFPVIFIVLLGAFSQLMFAHRLIDRWAGEETNVNYALGRGSEELYTRPNLYGTLITYFSLIFGLYYFSRKDYPGNKFYLLVIIFSSFVGHIISQTRGWIAVSIFISVMYFIFVQKLRMKNFTYFAIGLFAFYIIYETWTPLTIAVDNGLMRFATVESFAKGDASAEGTNIRFTSRLPKVMEGVRQNPITGFGFSNDYYLYADYHVGFATMLLQLGVFGFLFFIVFWFRYFSMIRGTNASLYNRNPVKGSLLVFSIALGGCLLMHFTSYQFGGFEYMLPPDYFFICFLFVFADFSVKEARYYDQLIRQSDAMEYEKRKVGKIAIPVN